MEYSIVKYDGNPVKPLIDILFCTGCGQCVGTCEKQALGMRMLQDWSYPYLSAPAQCDGCGKCGLACPENVIAMAAIPSVMTAS